MPVLTTFKDEGAAPVKMWTTDIEESALKRRERRAAEARRWRKENPVAAKAAKDRYRVKFPLAGKAHHLGKRYGLTVEQFNAMLVAQDDRCAICERPFGETRGKQPCVDHHHGSGRVRGLLHRDCNSALGVFRDSAALLRRAAEYVDQEDTCQ